MPHAAFQLTFVPDVSALAFRVICYLPLATWNPLSNLALIVAARPVSLPPPVHRTLALTRRVDPSLVPLDTLIRLKDLEIGGKVSEAPQVRLDLGPQVAEVVLDQVFAHFKSAADATSRA